LPARQGAIVVRRARPDDRAAGLVFAAAPAAYAAAAGSHARARRILESVWPIPGHSASFEHALVAECDGALAGVLIAYPARQRYRLHLALLRHGLSQIPLRRWPMLLAGLPALIVATPRPPRDAYYVGTIAVHTRARRRNIASTLGYHAELAAVRAGFSAVAAHTGTPHVPARRALERYGLRAVKARSRGYVLYTKDLRQGRAAAPLVDIHMDPVAPPPPGS
jgi:GNAT superfamily N-acetyltransferase